MIWQWKDVLQPLSIIFYSTMSVVEAATLLKEKDAEIGFVQDENSKEIIGFVTPLSLISQLTSSKQQTIEPLTNFLYVHHDQAAEKIHNCSLVIGVNSSHKPTGYLLMNELESKRNELQLKNFNDALNSAEMGIVLLDPLFQVQFMNEKAEQILGMELSVLLGRDYRKLIRIEQSFDEVLRGQTWFGIENTFNYKVISGQFSPVYEHGEIVGIIHNFYLKDQFKEAVNEIEFVREMNDYLQAFYQSSNEQILIVKPEGVVEKIAGAYFNSFWDGIHRDELPGKHLIDLKKHNIHYYDIVLTCMKDKEKVVMTQKRNNSTLLSTATPVMENKNVKKVFILSKDISTDQPYNSHSDDSERKYSSDKEIIYQSSNMGHLLDEVNAVAPLDTTVLITGESGVGKEVIAQRVHSLSKRAHEAFIAVNCGAIPPNIIESELFGHEKGAFTGADDTRIGLFEKAHNGTVFLDEIAELPLLMQVRLLRVLQEREVTRVGATVPKPINVRIIAATNQNLKDLVRVNKFREDLFYRLHVVPLLVPALRERKEDIAPLAIHFLKRFNTFLSEEKTISPDAINLLESYSWPGNVRELQNIIERLTVISLTNDIKAQDVYRVLWGTNSSKQSHITINGLLPLKDAVEETEKQLIQLAVQTHKTATEAAKVLNVSVSTISRRMKKYSELGGGDNDILL